jgi:hypothetical protein
MADTHERPSEHVSPQAAAPAPQDPRKPYEAPRLLKKRSVARATLTTVTGPTMSGLTMTG